MTDNHTMMTWDLESIFPGGSHSEQYARFRQDIDNDLKKAKQTIVGLSRKADDASRRAWVDFLLIMQDILMRIDHASSFATCLAAQDVADEKARIMKDEMTTLHAVWETLAVDIEGFALEQDDAAWAHLVDHPRLADCRFFWDELRTIARRKMDPTREKLAAELAVDGYHGWNQLYSRIAGDLRAEFTQDGKTETLSMGQLSNKLSSPDRAIRAQAFEKLESSWNAVAPLAAAALNGQAGFRLAVYRNRNWISALEEPLINGRLKEATLNAMWAAAADGAAQMAEYITIKKRVLGIDRFRWYDQWAPLGDILKTYTYAEAGDFVVKHLNSFSPDLGQFARMALDDRWIEAEDRSGKEAGGFCIAFPVKKQSRIFMTFSGSYDEMMTLAHELGHAYHTWLLRDRDFLAGHYPTNLAETASTFNELVVTDAAVGAAVDPAEKMSLLDRKLQEGVIMFCNIRCRFLFDSMFYEERKKGTVARARLDEMMLQAQKTAFGNILADDGYHPLFWASKLHFYETDMPFYNFPYTFGYLFAGGIYDRARREGPSFAAKYRALLADTGSMTVEEAARKHLGVDLTEKSFWASAVGRVTADIAEFARLAKTVKL